MMLKNVARFSRFPQNFVRVKIKFSKKNQKALLRDPKWGIASGGIQPKIHLSCKNGMS